MSKQVFPNHYKPNMIFCGSSLMSDSNDCDHSPLASDVKAFFVPPLSPVANEVASSASADSGLLTPDIRTPWEGVSGASPSPSLLNPMTEEDWNESSSRQRAFGPRLESMRGDDTTQLPPTLLPRNKNVISRRLPPRKRAIIHVEVSPDEDARTENGTELTLIDEEAGSLSEEAILSFDDNIALPLLNSSESLGSKSEKVLLQVKSNSVNPESDAVFDEYVAEPIPDDWCNDPTCSLALKDMTDNFRTIFESLGGGHAKVQDAISSNESVCDSPHPAKPDSEKNCPDATENVAVHHSGISAATVLGVKSPLLLLNKLRDGKSRHSNRAIDSEERIRNRAVVPYEQARRWQLLRNEMTFSSFADISRRKMHIIQTAKSLDELDGLTTTTSRARPSGQQPSGSPTALLEGFLSVLALDTNDEDKETLFYDSDPGDSRGLPARKRPRQMAAEKTNTCDENDMRKSSREARIRYRAFERNGKKKVDERQVQEIVEIMKTEQLCLLWHRRPTKQSPTPHPVCVSAWVERGAHLSKRTFVQPKLMWKQAMETHLDGRQLNVARHNPDRIDLVDIIRIHGCPTIDRRIFPFANRANCFKIETSDESYLFEAQSVQEKKRLVFGLKLTVARLASLIMVKDCRVVSEFFEPMESSVPGEAPQFVHGQITEEEPKKCE